MAIISFHCTTTRTGDILKFLHLEVIQKKKKIILCSFSHKNFKAMTFLNKIKWRIKCGRHMFPSIRLSLILSKLIFNSYGISSLILNVKDLYEDGDIIWIQDYHLMLIPQMLRTLLPTANITIGFFLHVPFPSSEFYR